MKGDKRPSPYPEPVYRIFKGDRATNVQGSRIPYGTVVQVIKFLPRRRVVIEYQGDRILTMLWCLKKKGLSKAPKRIGEDGEVEQFCYKCKEWWPADEEFFYPGFTQCKACYLSDKYEKRRKPVSV